jgi:O-glycosyl hydrolase
MQDVYQYSVKQAWFSDSATYPIIATLTFASMIVVGASFHQLFYLKDVRINPNHKHETIQSWGTERVRSVTSVISEGPAFHRSAFKSIHGKEGMGVDHEAWLKSKKEYMEK